jgi:2-polyprenyl-3-methyl-5-hydroxy-6-metoxy-1,4-benzoquinol methylase
MNKKFFKEYIENTSCLACGNEDVRTLLDLGNQPLANNYHKGEEQTKYPLKLNLCPECHHLQQSHAVNPDLMFKNYLYVSGTTKTLHRYFEEFSKITLKYNPNAKSVLDIACNDGTQLDYYKKIGLETYGVDPAENLYEVSSSKGHKVLCDYFNLDSIKNLNKTFDIITAQNVFAHTIYISDFLKACSKIMNDNSVLFIQTSQANMVVNNEFDTIYHEHISFFNILSMKKLVDRESMFLNDVFKPDIHGTSYVFVITKNNHIKGENLQRQIEYENKIKLHDMVTYGNYVSKCYQTTFNLKNKIQEFRNKNYKIIGYGAAAKGNTLLNFGNIKLDYIIDDNLLKHNLLTPGQNILIKSIDILKEYQPTDKLIIIPLAWNFFDEIVHRVKKVRNNNNDIFITYFPEYNEHYNNTHI